MQIKGFIIIVAAVACMMAAMVLLVMNFNDMSATRVTYTDKQAQVDSLHAAEIQALVAQDSTLVAALEKQSQEMAALKKQISNMKYKITLITE
jgi:hypothetical protein